MPTVRVLKNPDGPIFLDCKINADIAAPFMGEFATVEAMAELGSRGSAAASEREAYFITVN